LVAVLEVVAPDALELRRRRNEDARGGTLADCLEPERPGLAEGGELLTVHVPGEVRLCDRARVHRIGGDAVAGPAAGRLDREQDVDGLRLAIGEPRVVRAGTEVDVLEDDR
jgi:hypothetical protein